MDFSSFVNEIITEIRGLFGSQTRQIAPSPTGGFSPGQKVLNSPGGYVAPIHGTWHSSGGFTPQHHGVDMRCPAGTPVYPLTSGVVSNVGTDPMGGNVVNIQHSNGVKTYYAHLSTVIVQKGDRVTPNTVIAAVGNTGNAAHTFPHCHFQVWQNGQIQDPAKYFSVPAYTDLTAQEKRQGPWLSPQAKQEAAAFNMREHVAKRRVAFSNNCDKLLKLANRYSEITKKI